MSRGAMYKTFRKKRSRLNCETRNKRKHNDRRKMPEHKHRMKGIRTGDE